MPEELALEQGFGYGAAIFRHEGLLPAPASLVQGAGDKLLAGAALTTDADVQIGIFHLLDDLEDLPDLLVAADDSEISFRFGAVGFHRFPDLVARGIPACGLVRRGLNIPSSGWSILVGWLRGGAAGGIGIDRREDIDEPVESLPRGSLDHTGAELALKVENADPLLPQHEGSAQGRARSGIAGLPGANLLLEYDQLPRFQRQPSDGPIDREVGVRHVDPGDQSLALILEAKPGCADIKIEFASMIPAAGRPQAMKQEVGATEPELLREALERDPGQGLEIVISITDVRDQQLEPFIRAFFP